LKKSLAYIATAIVLGAVSMLAPVWLFPTEVRYEVTPDRNLSPLTELKDLPEKLEALFGIKANQPTDAISVSLMLAISVVSALGVSQFLKRRTLSE